MFKQSYNTPLIEELCLDAELSLCNGSIPDYSDGSNDGQGWGSDPND